MAEASRFMTDKGDAVFSGLDMLVKGALESGIDSIVVARLECPPSLVSTLESLMPVLSGKGVSVLVLPDAVQACAAWRSAAALGQRTLLILDAKGMRSAAARLSSLSARQSSNAVIAFGPCDKGIGSQAMRAIGRSGLSVLVPAVQMEVKPWVGYAFDMSARSGLPTALALGEELWHGLASVACFENRYVDKERSSTSTKAGAVPGAAIKSADARNLVRTYARDRGINYITNPPAKDEALPLGLVASGVGYARLRQLLSELGLIGRLPILRLGLMTPLDRKLIDRHCSGCRRLAVADHRWGQLYEKLRSTLDVRNDHEVVETYPLLSREDNAPSALLAGLLPILQEHPSVPREVLEGSLARLKEQVAQAGSECLALPERLPVAVPGSAVLDVSAVLGELRRDMSDAQYMTEQHSASACDLAVFGELDAASRKLIELDAPLRFYHGEDSRYAGGAAASLSGDETLRPVVLMGARQFMAQGHAAIADAARAGRALTFIIHTEQPEREQKRSRWRRRHEGQGVLDMSGMLQALSGRNRETPLITGEIDPTDRPRLRRLLERSIMGSGVRVVLARRRHGPRYYKTRVEKYEQEVTRAGFVESQQHLVLCPEVGGLSPSHRLLLGPLGVHRDESEAAAWQIAASWASADSPMLWALGNPAVGLATVYRTQPQRLRVDEAQLKDLPHMPPPIHARQEVWRASVAGIAGAGWSNAMRLLTHAAHAMGYRVRSSMEADQVAYGKAALGHVLLTSKTTQGALSVAGSPGRSTRPMYVATPTPGSADLLWGLELTEAARAVAGATGGVAGNQCTGAIIDTQRIAPLDELDRGATLDPKAMASAVVHATKAKHQVVCPYAQLSAWLFGHERYKPWMMLGSAMQRGLLPLTRDSIEQATVQVLGSSDARCALAFDVGRKAAVDPSYAQGLLNRGTPAIEEALETATEDLAQQFAGRSGAMSMARAVHGSTAGLLEVLGPLPEVDRQVVVTATHHCALWAGRRGGPEYVERFCGAIKSIFEHDNAAYGYDLTRRAIRSAALVMLVPDEVYLASLLTSPGRYRRDRGLFNIALERDDSIVYKHILHPEFELFKRQIDFSVSVSERVLRLLSRAQLMRRVRRGWYREHRDFRDRYLQVLEDCDCQATAADYRRWCEIVSCVGVSQEGGAGRLAVHEADERMDRLLAAGP